jgi:hypothetical protein
MRTRRVRGAWGLVVSLCLIDPLPAGAAKPHAGKAGGAKLRGGVHAHSRRMRRADPLCAPAPWSGWRGACAAQGRNPTAQGDAMHALAAARVDATANV